MSSELDRVEEALGFLRTVAVTREHKAKAQEALADLRRFRKDYVSSKKLPPEAEGLDPGAAVLKELEEIEEALNAVWKEIGRVAREGPRDGFRMSIPANPERDTDLIVVDCCRQALTALRAHRAKVERLVGAAQGALRNAYRDGCMDLCASRYRTPEPCDCGHEPLRAALADLTGGERDAGSFVVPEGPARHLAARTLEAFAEHCSSEAEKANRLAPGNPRRQACLGLQEASLAAQVLAARCLAEVSGDDVSVAGSEALNEEEWIRAHGRKPCQDDDMSPIVYRAFVDACNAGEEEPWHWAYVTVTDQERQSWADFREAQGAGSASC